MGRGRRASARRRTPGMGPPTASADLRPQHDEAVQESRRVPQSFQEGQDADDFRQGNLA